jgi:hypothetical protein
MTSILLTTNTTVQLLPQRALFCAGATCSGDCRRSYRAPITPSPACCHVVAVIIAAYVTYHHDHGGTQCIVLGDLFHMRKHYAPEAIESFVQWRQQHSALDMLLVRGNHERAMGDPPARCGLQCVESGVCARRYHAFA